MAVNHRNFAQTTLGAAITDTSGTSITVTSETSFPSAPFIISIDTEAMLVTVVSTTTWTVTRGYEGSTAATHTNGTAIYHDWSAGEADAVVLLDQTTPQTILNGFPAYEDDHADFTEQHSLVDKEYVDSAVARIGTRFYMLDAADGDVAAYKQTSLAASAEAAATVSTSNISSSTDTEIEQWISPSGMVWEKLNSGVYDLNVFVERTSGNRICRVFWRFYERKSDTSEVLIGTSNLGDTFTAKERQRIYCTLSADYVPSEGSRLVGKLYVNTTSGSTNTVVRLSYQGVEDSHWQVPISQEFLDGNYVRGPASATDAHLAVFDGATGKLIKDGGACTAAGLALLDDANAAAQLTTLGAAAAADVSAKLAKAGDTMTGNLIMDNMDVTLVKLLTLHGEIDDGNSSTAGTIDWNAGAAHKSTLTGNVTLAFTGYGPDLVPDMTGANTPSGEASASHEYNSKYAWYAFSDDSTPDSFNAWCIQGPSYPEWLQYQFPTAKTVTIYSVQSGTAAYGNGAEPADWTLQGSNNGADWTTLDTVTGGFIASEYSTRKYFVVDTPGSYTYYRLSITAKAGTAGYIVVAELELIESGIDNPSAPCFLTLKLVQDATGGRVITWPATVKGTPAINKAANAVSNVLFYWDGTNYYVLNGLQFVSATDKILGRSTAGAGPIEEIACTAAGRAILDDASAAAQLTTLGAPLISSGTAAPTTTPGKVGDIFIDTTGAKAYIAKGTASSADWVVLN